MYIWSFKMTDRTIFVTRNENYLLNSTQVQKSLAFFQSLDNNFFVYNCSKNDERWLELDCISCSFANNETRQKSVRDSETISPVPEETEDDENTEEEKRYKESRLM